MHCCKGVKQVDMPSTDAPGAPAEVDMQAGPRKRLSLTWHAKLSSTKANSPPWLNMNPVRRLSALQGADTTPAAHQARQQPPA